MDTPLWFRIWEWLAENRWSWIPLWYLVLNVIALLAYANDKHAATHGRWRTSEASLHLVELLGGWPGALLAQKIFRHKCSKGSYQFAFRCIVPTNLIALAYVIYGCATGDWTLSALFG